MLVMEMRQIIADRLKFDLLMIAKARFLFKQNILLMMRQCINLGFITTNFTFRALMLLNHGILAIFITKKMGFGPKKELFPELSM